MRILIAITHTGRIGASAWAGELMTSSPAVAKVPSASIEDQTMASTNSAVAGFPRRRATIGAAISLLLLACSSDPISPGGTDTPPPPPPPASLPVSPAVVSASPAALPAGSGSFINGLAPVAWVSMAPGTDTAAASVVITPQGGGAEVEVQAADGGFDPVPVPASGGDTLLIAIKHHSGPTALGYATVPLESRPIIIRTSPPKGKTDVPLNAVIVVIFSEPMDSASLSQAVTLTWSGGQVPATVRPAPVFGNPGLAAEVTPATPLLPGTSYELQVDTVATSALGATLDSTVRVEFTTDTTPTDTLPPPVDTLPPPTLAAPTVDIMESLLGDTVPVGWIRLLVDIESKWLRAVTYEWVYPGTSQDPTRFLSHFGSAAELVFDFGGVHVHNLHPATTPPGPGPSALAITATLTFERVGADTISLTVVEPDSVPWLVVNSFTVLEVQYSAEPGYWYYAPQLEVTDTSVLGGTRIVGFEMVSIPGIPSPLPKSWYVGGQPAVGTPLQLFPEIYGDFPLTFDAFDGHRSTGGEAEARLIIRDGSGHYHGQPLRATITPGEFPGTYTGGCWIWQWQGVWRVNPSCPETVRQRSP